MAACHGRARWVSDTAMEPDEPETESERRRANIMLLVGALVIVGGGIWLVTALVDARKSEECFESGRRNCAPISAPARN
jgi:hypothetical protein